MCLLSGWVDEQRRVMAADFALGLAQELVADAIDGIARVPSAHVSCHETASVPAGDPAL